MRAFLSIVVLLGLCVFTGCNETEDLADFTEEEEIMLGDQLADYIDASANFEVLSQEDNPSPYGYAGDLLQNLTNTDLITKSESYTWKLRILVDATRQAYVLPGGYLYVSTGMINFLDKEDQFTGLLAHLISHAVNSHTVETLVFKYGINGLKSIASSGSAAQLEAIVSDLDLRGSLLMYSGAMERQSDSLSVKLLGRIDQSCEGARLAFDKMLSVQSDRQPGMIVAHRLTAQKLESIQGIATSDGCDLTVDDASSSRYTVFRRSLP